MTRIRPSLYIIILVSWMQPAIAQTGGEITIGSKHTIYSDILEESREYWVSLPDAYDEASTSHNRYPLLIVLDGRSHFELVSGMVGFLSTSRNGSRRIPEMIVVAIRNVNRERDFTPDKVVTVRKNDTGGGDKFLTFLENELIPVLSDEYRTAPYSILVGHSLGGLLASHAFLKDETVFNAMVAIDPSFGTWDNETMDRKIDAVTTASFNRYLYIATANWGARNMNNRDRHVRFYEALHRKSNSRDFRAHLDYFENENHFSVPLAAFYQGISKIFHGYGLTYRDVDTLDQLVQHYQDISQRLSHSFPPPESLVNRLGYQHLRRDHEKEKAKALDYFVLNTQNYPDSYTAFDSLGEGYAATGENEKAIASYKKSLALYPDNTNARNQLEKLETGQ